MIYQELTGRLAVDLISALSSVNGIYRCAGCGEPFISDSRKRAFNREKWCSALECKDEQLRRNSKRYYYAKQKKAVPSPAPKTKKGYAKRKLVRKSKPKGA